MEERGVKVITISELVQRARPVTGASSLTRRRSISPPSEPQPSNNLRSPHNPIPPKQYPNPRVLNSLNHPTLIIGTLTLPNHNNPSTSISSLRCPKTNCFVFSDKSSTICCDVLELDVRIIGRKIHVLSWNFIPFKSGGGFLEIISWKLPQSSSGVSQSFSSSNVFPLISGSSITIDSKDSHKACYYVRGALESISPVSVVPCATSTEPNSSGSRNFCGFLVQIFVCECKLCTVRGSGMVLEDHNNYCFTKPLIVYFCGSASSWHPVISKLIGNVVMLSGLKKKLVIIGEEESQLMYVTTEKVLLHLPEVVGSKTVIQGKGECGTYTGVITGMYMQGMVVELDNEEFLLLTEQLLAVPHSLRVGAIVSVRNVHFVNPKCCWTKGLVLGACFKTSISLKSFSPFETGCCTYSQSQSLLGKFINSLAFSARLWVLLLISSFRKKFAGILTEKDILGSNHKEGLAQAYATSHLPSSVFRARHGVFREYCKHDSCGCGNEPNYDQLKLVVPISNFISHCEATWMKLLLEWETDSDLMNNYEIYSRLSCEGSTYSQPARRVLHNEDIGIILLGLVKISTSSGRLQLIDATGSIDVIVPDLPSSWNIDNIYEVNNFSLVMEGIPEQVDCMGLDLSESFLCRNIFSSITLMRTLNLAIYLLYHFRDTKSTNRPFYFCIKDKGNIEELQSGRFHLLLVSHKYPAQEKFQGEQLISNSPSMFAEALILPWDLFLAGKDVHTSPTKVTPDFPNESRHHVARKNYREYVGSKRYKIDQVSSRDLSSGLSGCGYKLCSLANSCSTSANSYQEQKCLNLCSPSEIPCFTTSHDLCLASSGILCRSKANAKVRLGCKPSAQKVLLEFKDENLCKYESLRVHGYYIMKHHQEDILCISQDINDVSYGKVIITSGTHLWSLSFSSDDVLPNTNILHLPVFADTFVCTNDAISERSQQNELPLPRLNVECPEVYSDIYVHISTDDATFLKEELKAAVEGLLKPYISLEEVADISCCNGTMMTGSVQSSGTSEPEFNLPEGNLISFHGHVLAVHTSGCSTFAASVRHKSPIDVHWAKIFQVINRVCIHVLVDQHIVRIFGFLSKNAYPIGFGPGIHATFHRILVVSGQNELVLTPTSFIAIKAIGVVGDKSIDKYNNPSVTSGQCNVASFDKFPSVLICEIMQCAECKPVQFHCRVVAVYILVLENNRKTVNPQSRLDTRSSVVNIPLAGFILDDGSSSCCCWTNSDKAATLLRLQEEFSHENNGRSIRGPKKSRDDEARGSSIHNLYKVIEKHGRVIVKNYGSMFDSSDQDLTFSVNSDMVFSSSDEDLLKFVILNACFGTIWTIVGSLMDSNAMEKLEKQLTEMEMRIQPMQNIWARDVNYTNPLCEARKAAQELLN